MDARVLDVLRRLVVQALALEEGQAPEAVSTEEISTRDLLIAVRRHRLFPLLHEHGRELKLPDEVTDVLDAWHEQAHRGVLVQAVDTVSAWQALTGAGIPALALKGLALAVLTTGQIDARGPGDVDLLVPPDRVADAHAVLTARGLELHEDGRIEPDMWAWRHVNRWGCALIYYGPGAEIDLHWRLDLAPEDDTPFDALWQRREQVTVGGTPIPTLSRYDALRHSAAHREGWSSIRTLVDLRRLARDPEAVAGTGFTPTALTSLAIARASIGLPEGLPTRLHERLDEVSPALLERAQRLHGLDEPGRVGAGRGTARDLRYLMAARRDAASLRQAVMTVVLPAHAALPVRSRSAWTGIPVALGLRLVRPLQRARRAG
jgi:hypothetical protein